jgi:hypothetical protein
VSALHRKPAIKQQALPLIELGSHAIRPVGDTERKLEGDVTKAVEVLSNRLSLTRDEQSSVLGHLIEGGDSSQ